MNEVQDRISEIIDVCFERNLNRACRAFGIPQSSMINIVKGKRNKPSFENIIKIVSHPAYKISVEWLVLGVGSMFNESNQFATKSEAETNIDYKDLYMESQKEVDKLKSKIIDIYENQHKVKEDYPNAMGSVKGARVG